MKNVFLHRVVKCFAAFILALVLCFGFSPKIGVTALEEDAVGETETVEISEEVGKVVSVSLKIAEKGIIGEDTSYKIRFRGIMKKDYYNSLTASGKAFTVGIYYIPTDLVDRDVFLKINGEIETYSEDDTYYTFLCETPKIADSNLSRKFHAKVGVISGGKATVGEYCKYVCVYSLASRILADENGGLKNPKDKSSENQRAFLTEIVDKVDGKSSFDAYYALKDSTVEINGREMKVVFTMIRVARNNGEADSNRLIKVYPELEASEYYTQKEGVFNGTYTISDSAPDSFTVKYRVGDYGLLDVHGGKVNMSFTVNLGA